MQVSLVGKAHVSELEEVLREWFNSEGQRVHIARAASVAPDQLLDTSGEPALRAWVVLRSAQRARIVFADARSRRFFVRDVPLDHGLDELGREKLAQILLASFQAFAERRVRDTPLEEVKAALSEPAIETPAGGSGDTQPQHEAANSSKAPSTPPRVLPPRPRESSGSSWISWALYGGYSVSYRGPAGFAQGPSAGVEGWFDLGAWGLGVAAGGRYELPHTESGPWVDVRVQNTAFRFGVLVATMPGGRPSWVLGLGVGWDRLGFRPLEAGEGVMLRASDEAQRPVLASSVTRFAHFGPLRLGLSIGADFALEKLHYDVMVEHARRRNLTPWQLAPHGMLTVGVSCFALLSCSP